MKSAWRASWIEECEESCSFRVRSSFAISRLDKIRGLTFAKPGYGAKAKMSCKEKRTEANATTEANLVDGSRLRFWLPWVRCLVEAQPPARTCQPVGTRDF